MSRRFAVVHEAEADFTIATDLADRVMVEAIDWLKEDEELLFHQREWIAEAVGNGRLTWKGVNRLAREVGTKAHGHFEGEPGEPDAAAARRAILFLLSVDPNLNAIVLIRDQDDQPERRKGLEQARRADRSGIPIVVGLAIVERECWVISGFEPENDAERELLDTKRTTLGFDPRIKSHDLTACKNDTANRSPKRVLRNLMGGNVDREHHCWSVTPLEVLRNRGAENGLAAYLDEVRAHLAGLIGHVPQ